MKTDYKENEHKREMKDMLKISDYTNTVREEIEGSSGLRKIIQRNLDKMNEVIGDIDMSEKQMMMCYSKINLCILKYMI